jgi:hypothetical protein
MRRALLLGLLLATACSSSHSSSNAAAVLSSAVQRTRALGSCHLDVTIGPLRESVVEDFATRNTGGSAAVAGKTTSFQVVDGVEYIKVPPARRAAFGNPSTPWVSIGSPGHPVGAAPIDVLLYGAYNVKRTASHSFGGAINLLNVLPNMPAAVRAGFAQRLDLAKGIQGLTRFVGNSPTFTITLDDHEEIVGFSMTATGVRSPLTMRYVISDFGVPVQLSAPPARLVSPYQGQNGPTI